jgi:transcriptional regulator GlxA family with amidase domain
LPKAPNPPLIHTARERAPIGISAKLPTGLSDQSHLNRTMRAERGVTPGALRRSFKAPRI